MIWCGGLIVLAAFGAIIRRFEIRIVLLSAGFMMAILAGNPATAIDAFSAAMVNGDLVPAICSVIGFSFVLKVTGCEGQLIQALSGFACKYRIFLIPGAVLLTFALNIFLPGAASCAAVVGTLLIPLLMSAGIRPAAAAGAVAIGTWGSVLNPDQLHNPFIASLAGVSVPTVIAGHAVAAVTGAVLAAGALTALAVRLKEDQGYVREIETEYSDNTAAKTDYLRAVVPVIPLIFLVLGSPLIGLLPWEVTIPQAMIFGAVVAYAITLRQPKEISRQFFAGMGQAFGGIIGTIVAAAVFTRGMELIGLTDALIQVMKHSDAFPKLMATGGPFLIAVLTGSGDAATLAFNATVTPFANQVGQGIAHMGSQAFLNGSLGRSMSPISGAVIICAALAGADPIEVAKRNAPGMIIATAAVLLILI